MGQNRDFIEQLIDKQFIGVSDMKVYVGFLALVSGAREIDTKNCIKQCDTALPDAMMKCLAATRDVDIKQDFVDCNKQEILVWSDCKVACSPSICHGKCTSTMKRGIEKCSEQEKGAAAQEWSCIAEASGTYKKCWDACPEKKFTSDESSDVKKEDVAEDEEATVEVIEEH